MLLRLQLLLNSWLYNSQAWRLWATHATDTFKKEGLLSWNMPECLHVWITFWSKSSYSSSSSFHSQRSSLSPSLCLKSMASLKSSSMRVWSTQKTCTSGTLVFSRRFALNTYLLIWPELLRLQLLLLRLWQWFSSGRGFQHVAAELPVARSPFRSSSPEDAWIVP